MTDSLNFAKAIDELMILGALFVSFISLMRSTLYQNAVPVRVIKFALVFIFVGSHYILLFFRPSLLLVARSIFMELEFVVAAVYMLIDGIQAFALMNDQRKRSHDTRTDT